jgi:hypothetical protein
MMDKKMIAARVTESYTSLFLTPNDNDGSRNARIAMIGAFEVRLLEIPSFDAPEGLNVWVELYAGDLHVGVDSCKCNDLDEAVDAATLLIIQARRLNTEAR